jgi:hypothetical protein
VMHDWQLSSLADFFLVMFLSQSSSKLGSAVVRSSGVSVVVLDCIVPGVA